MESLLQFKDTILKRKLSRKHKVRGSMGVYDAYKYYRKNKPSGSLYIITESLYFSIVRMVNNLLVEKLLEGEDITFPCRMGRLELRKVLKLIKIVDGKVHANLPIDWNRTLELWYSDPQSYKDKTLVRVEEDYIYKVYYNRGYANYTNKCYYEFIVNRNVKERLKLKIKEGKIDAMYLDKNVRI